MRLQEYFSIQGAKTPYALAKFLGITPANVYEWIKSNRSIPIYHCAKIERFTNSLVSCEELAPTFKWDELWNIYERRKDRTKCSQLILKNDLKNYLNSER